MADSGYSYIQADSRIYSQGHATAYESSTSITGNYSTVHWDAWVDQLGGINFVGSVRPHAGIVNVWVGGTLVCSQYYPLNKGTGGRVWSASGDINIGHNSDGTGSTNVTVSLSAGVDDVGKITWYYGGGSSGSSGVGLSTIPRTTNISVNQSSVKIGNPITISGNGASSSFKHKLYVTWNGTKYTIDESLGSSVSKSYTIPKTWANNIPNATSGTCTFTLETYSGSTKIGTSSTNVTVTVPDETGFKPSITSVTVSEANTAVSSKMNFYVQNQSKCKVVTVSAGAYSSTIKDIAVIFDSVNYSGDDITTNTLNNSGTISYSVTITDSRNRTATKSGTISVAAYTPPTITKSTVTRCNSSYTVDENNGTYGLANFSYLVCSLSSKNTFTFGIYYRQNGASSWTRLKTYTSAYEQTLAVQLGNIFSKTVSYEVKFEISDYFTKASSVILKVSPTFTLINFGANGKSLGIGVQSSNDGTMEVSLSTKFYINGNWINLSDLYNRLVALETWKSQVLAGATRVVTELGRNLLLNSSLQENLNNWSIVNDSTDTITTEFVEKDGYKCFHISSTAFTTSDKSRHVEFYQSILGKLKSNETYTYSCWYLTENVQKGTTDNFLSVDYTSGNYGTYKTWFTAWTCQIINANTQKWVKLEATITASEYCDQAIDLRLIPFFRDFTGDIYIREIGRASCRERV